MNSQQFTLLAQHLPVEQVLAEVTIKYDQLIDNNTAFPITFDSYQRKDSQSNRPVMVFLHGGSWSGGSKSQFANQALYFAFKHDFFTLSIDYCLSGDLPFPAAIKDSKTVIRWLKAHADRLGIDANAIMLVGTSAGANIAAIHLTSEEQGLYTDKDLYGQYNSEASAAILLNGEYDIWDLIANNSLLNGICGFIGSLPNERPDLINAISPIQHINQQMPATLLLHGDSDQFVSPQQSLAFADKMISFGIHAEAEVLADKKHNWFNDPIDFIPTIKRIEKFIHRLNAC